MKEMDRIKLSQAVEQKWMVSPTKRSTNIITQGWDTSTFPIHHDIYWFVLFWWSLFSGISLRLTMGLHVSGRKKSAKCEVRMRNAKCERLIATVALTQIAHPSPESCGLGPRYRAYHGPDEDHPNEKVCCNVTAHRRAPKVCQCTHCRGQGRGAEGANQESTD